MKTVLVLDDNLIITKSLESFLSQNYQVITFNISNEALVYLTTNRVDLLLMDIHMPVIDGMRILEILHERGIEIPTILLTSDDTIESEIKGFQKGAIDYIKKPIFKEVLLHRIQNHLSTIERVETLKHNLVETFDKVKDLESKFVKGIYLTTDLHDVETGGHIRRISAISKMISEAYQLLFDDQIVDDYIALLEKASTLHDIGKMAVPDDILKKPGKLTDAEFEIMKTHTTKGKEALSKLREGSDDPFLLMAEDIAYCHHEKWNGQGYPRGLTNESIPLAARIVAVADVYDALVSKRVYKPPMTHQEAVDIILSESGKHFDPQIVNAFYKMSRKIEQLVKEIQED